jgi:hypothetical protein
LKSVSQAGEVKWSDEVLKEVVPKQQTKEERERARRVGRMVKKIEFLLCFASEVVYREPVEAAEGVDPIRTIDSQQLIASVLEQ